MKHHNFTKNLAMKYLALSMATFGMALVTTDDLSAIEIDGPKPDRKITYKHASDVDLQLHLFEPEELKPGDNRPAIVFFFGGGWNSGSPSQFYPHCRLLADHGMVAMSAEYRVKSRNNTTPFECVADGKSAVRYIRQHAEELGIDPGRLASGGGSAGGHVAACTGTLKTMDEPGEDLSISSVPDAMVLYNPVADTSKRGYGNERLAERYREISPVEHVSKDTPPTIIFHGRADTTVPYENVERFEQAMKKVDRRCELVGYDDQAHGFFNYGRGDNKSYEDTTKKMLAFLKSLGWIE